jgi:hypothetical protein
MNRGALVIPILHDLIWVNMNTLRLEVTRSKEEALITKDRLRVDVRAEFYVASRPTTTPFPMPLPLWARKHSNRSNSKIWLKVNSWMRCEAWRRK